MTAEGAIVERRARLGCAVDRKMDAGILELGPDNLVLYLVEAVGLSCQFYPVHIPGLAAMEIQNRRQRPVFEDELQRVGIIGIHPVGEGFVLGPSRSGGG